MKVWKVLADKIPDCCGQCKFNHYYSVISPGYAHQHESVIMSPLGSKQLCDFTEMEITKHDWEEERPDWCPLRDIQEVDGHNLYWWQSEALGGENNE